MQPAKQEKSTVILSKLWWTYGGDEEDRTLDLTDANRTLSQLSYAPDEEYYITQYLICLHQI